MRSLKVCSAVIYFMAKGEKLTREQVFGNHGNPVYAIWPQGKKWGVSYHDCERWGSLSYIPPRSERDAYALAIGHYYKNFLAKYLFRELNGFVLMPQLHLL